MYYVLICYILCCVYNGLSRDGYIYIYYEEFIIYITTYIDNKILYIYIFNILSTQLINLFEDNIHVGVTSSKKAQDGGVWAQTGVRPGVSPFEYIFSGHHWINWINSKININWMENMDGHVTHG